MWSTSGHIGQVVFIQRLFTIVEFTWGWCDNEDLGQMVYIQS